MLQFCLLTFFVVLPFFDLLLKIYIIIEVILRLKLVQFLFFHLLSEHILGRQQFLNMVLFCFTFCSSFSHLISDFKSGRLTCCQLLQLHVAFVQLQIFVFYFSYFLLQFVALLCGFVIFQLKIILSFDLVLECLLHYFVLLTFFEDDRLQLFFNF